MNPRLLLLIIILYFASANRRAVAQEKTVSGTVTDARGNPLPGIIITVKGASLGTATDTTGHYALGVPEGNWNLIFSFIGYRTREVKVGNQTSVDVAMEDDVIYDAERVVTALNIERDTRTLQASVTQISGDNFTQARELNMATQLEGRVAGVNVTKVASGPAGSTRVVIRGTKTLGGSNQPLYVVDGTPIDNSNFGQSGEWGGPDNGDGLNSISPDDIESMTVLKGASSAALYGSRAVNGVILITTKKGKFKKGIGIEFNSNLVAEKVINYTDFQNSHGAGGYIGPTLANAVATKAAVRSSSTEPDQNTAFNFGWNSQAWGPKFDGTDVVQPDGVIRKYQYAGDNWKRFYNTGITRTNSIALSGGSEAQRFRFSYTNLKNNGVIPNSGFNRDNIMLSSNSRFGKKITLVGKVMYSHEDVKNRPMISDSPGNAVQAIYNIPGDQNVELYKGDPNKLGAVPKGMITPDGRLVGEEFQATNNLWGQNPYWAAHQFINSDVRDRINASANLRYDISNFLYVTGQAGMDWYTKRIGNLIPQGTGFQPSGYLSNAEARVREINLQWTAGFDKRFGKIHANVFVGGNRMRNTFKFTNVGSKNFDYSYAAYGINSLFGSAEISYDNYLFITATAREDWFPTSNTKSNHPLSPSIGCSFVFTDAIKKLPALLSFGKIRVAYGQVGNASSFAPHALSGTNVRPLGYFVPPPQIIFPNPDLKPSISSEFEFGLDVRFLQNRLGLDFTYYAQTTFNDIAGVGINPATGFGSTMANMVNLQNRGVEVLITGTPLRGAVTWDVSLNFARNINKVVALIAGLDKLVDEEPRTRTVRIQHIVGSPYGMITGLVQQKTPDGRLVYDKDGAPLTDGNYYTLGNGVPKFTGGLNNSITYKSFNLGALIDFKYGGQIYSGTNVRMTEGGFTKQTLQGRAGEAPLTVTGAIQTGTDGSGNAVYSDFTKTLTPGEAQNYWSQLGERSENKFVYDASFIKLRQFTLGYSIPKSILSKTPFQSLTFSLVGRNLAILYKKTPNIDPESSYTSSNAQGLDYFGMPPTRTYGFNLRVTF